MSRVGFVCHRCSGGVDRPSVALFFGGWSTSWGDSHFYHHHVACSFLVAKSHIPGNSAGDLFGMVSSRDPNSKVGIVTSNVWG